MTIFRGVAVTLGVSVLSLGAGCTRHSQSLSGEWQLAWQGRLGTEREVAQIEQKGSELKGTFRTPRYSTPLKGTIHGADLQFTVIVPGPRPYEVEFAGSNQLGKISGRAEPKDMLGQGFAGHGGEISRQYYTWSATRSNRAPG